MSWEVVRGGAFLCHRREVEVMFTQEAKYLSCIETPPSWTLEGLARTGQVSRAEVG